MIRWLVRLASVLATALLAYGWGDFATDPGPLEAIVLIVLTVVLVAALQRLYRAGGVAAFEWDDGEDSRRAPGEPVSDPVTTAPSPVPARRGSRPSGSLWAGGDRDEEP